MDRNCDNNKSVYDKRIEKWREQRVEKLASRLQRNSDKTRKISASVLGIGYPRQSITMKPGLKFNNHKDQRWNSGYLGHNSMHRQYPQDYRTNLRGGHGLFRSLQQKQGAHFSSQYSLHGNRKAADKSNRRYSSCTNINYTNVDETKTVTHFLVQNTENETDNLVLESNTTVLGGGSQENAISGMILENVNLVDNPDVDDSEIALITEPDLLSADEDIDEENSKETPNNDCSQVVPVSIIVHGDSEPEASEIVVEEQNDIAKEIENMGKELANIRISYNDTCNSGFMTPMKRERRQALLDSTNIIPSSTIKYAVREVRKHNEIEILLTPVRRSIRLSSTPVSRTNLCIQRLEDLSPEVRENAKFVGNTSINIPPDY